MRHRSQHRCGHLPQSAQVLSQSVLIGYLNVPLSKDDGVTITDDTRLRAVVPTMNFLKEQGARPS